MTDNDKLGQWLRFPKGKRGAPIKLHYGTRGLTACGNYYVNMGEPIDREPEENECCAVCYTAYGMDKLRKKMKP